MAISLKWQPLDLTLSTTQLRLCLGSVVASLVLGYSLIYPSFSEYRALQRRHDDIQRQWQRASTWIRQTPPTAVKPSDFNQSLTRIALANDVLISNIIPIDAHQWQIEGSASYAHFDQFLHTLCQEPLAWALITLQLQMKADQPLQWRLTWQRTPPALGQTHCLSGPNTSLSRALPKPRVLTDSMLQTIPLSRLVWLGVIQQAHHTAALIRFADFPPRLIEPGDLVGPLHWRLVALNAHQSEWLDPEQHRHILELDLASHGE